jgi:hypothetical protein
MRYLLSNSSSLKPYSMTISSAFIILFIPGLFNKGFNRALRPEHETKLCPFYYDAGYYCLLTANACT